MTYTDDPTADPEFLEWKRLKADREAVAALNEERAAHQDALNEQIRNAQTPEELTAYLHAQDQAGNLPGREPAPRRQGEGAPTEDEIKACKTAEELDALLASRVGDATASELGLVGRHEG